MANMPAWAINSQHRHWVRAAPVTHHLPSIHRVHGEVLPVYTEVTEKSLFHAVQGALDYGRVLLLFCGASMTALREPWVGSESIPHAMEEVYDGFASSSGTSRKAFCDMCLMLVERGAAHALNDRAVDR